MSLNQQLEWGYIYDDDEPSVVYENVSVLQDVGEYVLAPPDTVNTPTINEPRTPETSSRSNREVFQDQLDEDNYSLAQPNNCPTERFGAHQNITLESKPIRKDGRFQKKHIKVAAAVLVSVLLGGGVLTLAVVLTLQSGITNIFYFIWPVIEFTKTFFSLQLIHLMQIYGIVSGEHLNDRYNTTISPTLPGMFR